MHLCCGNLKTRVNQFLDDANLRMPLGQRFGPFTHGVGFKDPYYCEQADQGDSLPGDRYFLFSVYCDNANMNKLSKDSESVL